MKFIIKFLGWVTFLLIAFSFLGSFLPSQTSNTTPSSSYKKPIENKELVSKPVTRNKSFLDKPYFYFCSEGGFTTIEKKLSAGEVLVNSFEKGKASKSSLEKALNALGCQMAENKHGASYLPSLRSLGYKLVGSLGVTNSKGKRFNVCKMLDNRDRPIYFLGNCP